MAAALALALAALLWAARGYRQRRDAWRWNQERIERCLRDRGL